MGTIGVLAVQGGFAAHVTTLRSLGHEVREIRAPRDLDDLDGLVLPGGESTAQLRIIGALGLERGLVAHVAKKRAVLATCAGLILAAREVTSPVQRSFAFLDVAVERNAWGRQLDSFEARADESTLALTFIRAPRIRRVGAEVEVLARYRGEPVLVRQGRTYGATFHPELGPDPSVHRLVFGD